MEDNTIVDVQIPQASMFAKQNLADFGCLKITTKNEISYSIVTVTDDYTVRSNDRIILVNQSSGTKTITLPAGNIGKVFTIKALTANQVDISSAQNIDGASSKSLTSQYESLTVVFDGQTWNII